MDPVASNVAAKIARPGPVVLRWGLLAVIVAAALLYIFADARVGLWDRDEPRYAQCSRQMLQGLAGPDGHQPDWVVPRYLNHLRIEKPPLVYYAQAAVMGIIGATALAARMPSSLCMLGVLAILAVALWRAAGPKRAFWTVFIMASNALSIMSATMCITDAMLLLWITIGQLCLYGIWRGNRSWRLTAGFWVAMGLAGMTKGPIVLAVILATLAALAVLDYFQPGGRRAGAAWWLRLRPWVGLPIMAAILAPWLIALHVRSPGFLTKLFDLAGRHVGTSMEHHYGPPGFYIALCLATFFPWGLFIITAVTVAWKHRNLPQVRFALAALLGPWIFQECMKTKLPFYVLPAFPPLAFLTADALIRCFRRQHDDLVRPIAVVAATVWAVTTAVVGLGPWALALPAMQFGRSNLPDLHLGPQPWKVMAMLSLLAVVYAASVLMLFARRRLVASCVTMGLGAMAILTMVLGVYLPNAPFFGLSEQLAEVLKAEGATHPGDVVMACYKEPSLAFYQGGTIREAAQNDYLRCTPLQQWTKWVVLPDSEWRRTPADLREHFQVVGTVHGCNYAGAVDGHRVLDVVVIRRTQ